MVAAAVAMANVAEEKQQQQQRAPPPGEDPERFWRRQAAGDAAMQVIWKRMRQPQAPDAGGPAVFCHAQAKQQPQAPDAGGPAVFCHEQAKQQPQALDAGGPAFFGLARGIGSPWGNFQLRQGASTLHMALIAIDQPCAIVVAC